MAPPPAASTEPAFIVLAESDIVALGELLRMEDSRSLDAALVSRHLQSATPEVRARAVLAAARTGNMAAAPLVLQALNDSDAGVRARAAFALGELGDSSAATVTPLSTLALGDELTPALEAVHALGKLAASAVRPVLDSLLARAGPARLVQEALLAAWRLPRSSATHDLIAAQLRSDDVEIRWRAAYALGRVGGPPAVAALLAVSTDPDERVRANALRGLRAPVADSAGARAAALSALLAAARDPHPHVRINAINQLPGYAMPEQTGPVLAAALADVDPSVAVAAALALQQSSVPAAAPALNAVARSDRPDGLRAAALHALARADSGAAGALAAEWTDSARWLVRFHAARVLARTPRAQSRPLLLRLARDAHYLVASEALASMRVDSALDARRIYVELLGAAHPLVRAAALRGLGDRANQADLDVLLQAYAAARSDSVREAALAAVNALARLKQSGAPVERSFFLRFADAPADPVLFRAIADSIGTPPSSWGQAPARIQPGETAFYIDAVRRLVAPVLAGTAPPRAVITTAHGDIVLELAASEAPLTVHNFITLIERGYYAGTRWHRVVPNFVIQDGDPRGDGSGGPGYAIRDEINPLRYLRGTLGMALAGPDTGGSQFFITHSPQPHLDGGYTVFGRVLTGMDIVDRVMQEEPILGFRVFR